MERHFPERVSNRQMDEYGKRKEDSGNGAKAEQRSNRAQDIKKGVQEADSSIQVKKTKCS